MPWEVLLWLEESNPGEAPELFIPFFVRVDAFGHIEVFALTSGAVASVLAGEKGLIYGIGCTALLTIAILIAGMCIYGISYTASALIKSCMMILCGAISGVFVVNRKRKIKF